ncbi:hypothetical protein FB2170_01090 [Maribacter sp. HTCC2170]|nr:hypothetical protein FB2170_01090 [Maribacter sp. HTCC2170]
MLFYLLQVWANNPKNDENNSIKKASVNY